MARRKTKVSRVRRRGAMLVLVAITMILLVIAAAFSIDVAYMQLTRTELRTSTDAAARAATEALAREQSVAAARQAARDLAAANLVAGDPLLLADEDIIFGHADAQANGVFDFTEGGQPLNSIRVMGRRTTDSPSGPANLLFPGTLGPRTFRPIQNARTVNRDRDICIVVDRSGSMNRTVTGTTPPSGWGDSCRRGPHPGLSRWAALDEAVTIFLAALLNTDQDELVGLVSYSSRGSHCPGRTYQDSRIEARLSPDYVDVQQAMTDMVTERIAGWTNIAAGVDSALEVLTDPDRTRPYAEKMMIVLTDGRENRPQLPGRRVVQAATEAVASAEIVIHTITFSAEANESTMREVARVGGGNHYHALTAQRLEEVFIEIASTLPVVMAE